MGVLRIFGCWLRFSRFAIFKVGVDISMSHPMCITNVTFFSSMLSCPFPPLSIAKVQGPSTLPRAVAPEGLKPWWGRTKGQLISKANCQAVNSSKKQTNEFVFTSVRCVFVRFLEEIEDYKKAFRNYLTFRKGGRPLYFCY